MSRTRRSGPAFSREGGPDQLPCRYAGVFRVEWGTGVGARLLAGLLRLPRAGERVRVTVEIRDSGRGVRWDRRFGDRSFRSLQREAGDGCWRERFGILEFRFREEVDAATIRHRQEACRLRLGPVALPLPSWAAPCVSGTERAGVRPGATRVAVEVTGPLVGRILAYEGDVVPEAR